MATASRIDTARRQLRAARIGIGVVAVAVAGLASFAFVARAAHPGSTSPARDESSATATFDDDSTELSGSFGFDGGSIGPSTGAPSVQSGGS